MKLNFKKKTILRLYSYLKKNWIPYSVGVIGLGFVSFMFNLIAAYSIKSLTNSLITKNIQMLINGLKLLGFGSLLIIIIMPFLSYAFNSSVKKTTGLLRKSLFSHINYITMSYIENKHSGDLISRMTNDVQMAENAYSQQFLMLVMASISGIGSAITIFMMDWRLGIIALLLGILTVISNTFFIIPIKKISDKVQQSFSILNQKLIDTFGGIQVIRIFNLSGIMNNKYDENNKEIRSWSMKRVIKNSLLNGFNAFLGLMGYLGFIIIGSIMVINKALNFGTLMAVMQMMNGLMWMFNSIGNYITQLQGSLAGADRIFEIMDIPIEEDSKENMIGILKKNFKQSPNIINNYEDSAAGKDTVVEFKNVNFSYDNDVKVIKNLNMRLESGKIIAIVGTSGSGKSTLFKLLLRFYNMQRGNISVFNKNIEDYEVHELRKLIAYVPQDNYLFSGTISENIGYSKEKASMEEIIEAAKSANAHDFIMSLPDMYETEVGERGAHLSGGQRQRIAIARAILKNAPILLLDEATSSLDSESEQAVQSALEILMKGRSTLVIAHRLSTIKNANKILVLEEGKIIEEGRHEELIHSESTYARLYNLQFSR